MNIEELFEYFNIKQSNIQDDICFIKTLSRGCEKGIISIKNAENIIRNRGINSGDIKACHRNLVILHTKMFLLKQNDFYLSQDYLFDIHKDVFSGIISAAGKIRNCNIKRKEECLNGDSVKYSPCDHIMENLDYDFYVENNRNYNDKNIDQKIKLLIKFYSNIWQAHPFFDGNTRSTAIFMIKYLEYLKLNYDNELFFEYFGYLRNALVRNNYSVENSNKVTSEFLVKFFEKLLKDNSINLDINETYYIKPQL